MEKKLYDLTAPQKSIWLTEQFYKDTNINNVCGVCLSSIPLDYSLFEKAIKIFVQNNESFNIRLTLENGEIKQYFEEYLDFKIDTILVNSDEERVNLENKINSKGFKLLNSPLFKFTIFKYPDGHGGFILNESHLISDSWTTGIVGNEISKIYLNLKNGLKTEKEKELSYSSFINAEQEYKNSEKFKRDKEYWENIFKTIPEIATIPSFSENQNSHSCAAKRILNNINSKKLDLIKTYITKNKISLYNLFMGVFALYLGRVSNLDEFVIGTPILNRTNFKEKQITGMFINTLPLKFNINHEEKFTEFLSKIAKDSMGLLRHQRYSYNYILEDLRKKDSSLPGLYNILFSYQITKMTENIDLLPYEARWVFNGSISDDLNIHVFEYSDSNNLQIAYDYKINKYSEEEISKIHDRILHIIDQIINNENVLLKEIEIVTEEEKHKILYEFNNTKANYPKDKTISQLFEEQVEKTPDNVALVFEDKKLTYRELNEKANQLANYLRKNNIKKQDIIGIMVNRSLEMIVAILAVLKSGACYIPIDPEYPQDRIEYMLSNSNAKTLLTFKKLKNKINFNNKIYSLNKNNLKNINNPNDLAYIIYTSGTTGQPKGVMITHKSLTNLTNYCNNYVEYLKNNIYKAIVSITTISFDIFIFETIISLQKGLKLILANKNEQLIPRLLENLIIKNNIEILQTTPSRMQLLVNNIKDIPSLSNIKYFTLAGEQLQISLVKQIKNICTPIIYNGYGPSETTIFSTLTNITNHQTISIGKPLDNTQIYILDSNLNICPIGVPGELYISGDGVGPGYINKLDLTQKSYIKNIFSTSNTTLYKSGDLGFYQTNGEIICLGRSDNQVKIRGLRIELEEIENEILKNKNINNCVVIKKRINNHDYLCAYYTTSTKIEISSIREYLNKQLPNYMVPH